MDPVSPGSPVRILRRAKMGNDSKVTGMDALQRGKEVSLSPPTPCSSSSVYVLSSCVKYKLMERRDYVLSCFDTFSNVLGTLLDVLWMFKDMFRTKNQKPRTKREGEGKGCDGDLQAS